MRIHFPTKYRMTTPPLIVSFWDLQHDAFVFSIAFVNIR
eukprot:UN07620